MGAGHAQSRYREPYDLPLLSKLFFNTGDLSDGDTAPGEVVENESSMYDILLTTLKSCNNTPPDVYKKRRREEEEEVEEGEEEEGRSDFKEEDDSISPCVSEEEDFCGEGTGNEFSRSHVIESKLHETSTVSIVDNNEDAESEDDVEESDTDQEQNLGVDAQTIVKASLSTSSFHEHLSYKLSEEEVDNLSNKKWEYKWDVPA
ncbi:digestive organ expansion factor homolog [Jatropha curcas]|uniref:digestive organ expansion factor homolog n=1 Tax=Jatropha curcas TaxID=180498 RepID=UPI0018942880|nr:digestive organ expansion factor homolog [Jatropha curcas]